MAFSTFSIFPIIPITGVGLIGVILLFLFIDSLYKETFPPVTGVSKTLQASEIPLHEVESCQYPVSLLGEEKFKKWGLFANVVGEVIETNEVIITHKSKIVAQIPTSALSDDTPVNFHDVINDAPEYLLNKWEWKENNLPEINELKLF